MINDSQEFKELVSRDNNKIKDVLCHNFSYENGDGFSSSEGNSLFIIFLKQKYKWIKITQKINGNANGLRLKMYYASAPENDFTEEQSYELGFMDGEEYSYIFKLSGESNDAFRFDFGIKPIEFHLQKFIITNPSFIEILNINSKSIFNKINVIIKYGNKKNINFSYIINKVKKEGIKTTLKSIKNTASVALKEAGEDKKSIQVTEPYKIEIKNKLLPKRKKVLHFIENFHTGGSSRLIIDIIEHYGHKYDNKIFTMAYRGEEEFLNVDVKVIDIDDDKKILKMIEDYSPDIIHTHIWEGEWYHKVFDLLGDVNNCKFIENINTPVKPILRDYIDKYVFVSNYVLENFHDMSDEKSMVIYPGSNFDMFTRKLGDNYLAKDTIGMVYRLGYDKLNQYSIDVFIKTVQKRPNTKAIIVGGGPQYQYFVDKVKSAGIISNFTFTGYVPYVELPLWYEKFTVFVAPVWKESFGQVTPFAMSMGIPVAGYNIGAIYEIINNESLLASPDNSDELSKILVDLLDDYDKCKTIGMINQERSWKKFGVNTMVDDYDKLYSELTR